MKLTLARPPGSYDQNDQAQTRRSLEQAFEKVAASSQLGQEEALIFANLPDPTKVPIGSRRFVTDRGTHGKPVWSYAAGWVDGTGAVVT